MKDAEGDGKTYAYQTNIYQACLRLYHRSIGIPHADAKHQASHLCNNIPHLRKTGSNADNHKCCEPTHMCSEPDAENKRRNNCPGWLWVYADAAKPEEGFWFNTCQHGVLQRYKCVRWTLPPLDAPYYRVATGCD